MSGDKGGVIYDPPSGTNRVAKYFGTDRVKMSMTSKVMKGHIKPVLLNLFCDCSNLMLLGL